jgi:hypothetical protein
VTEDEWAGCCFVMEHAFKGDMDANKRDAYRVFLGAFEAEAVMAALRLLAEGGDPWLPAAPEIVAAARSVGGGDSVPSWSEALELLYRAFGAGARAGYFASWAEKQARAAEWLEGRGAPLVARFLEAETYERLYLAGLDDDEWGAARRRDLERRWREFCVEAGKRLARGRASGAGPRSLSEAALLDASGVGALEGGGDPRALGRGG